MVRCSLPFENTLRSKCQSVIVPLPRRNFKKADHLYAEAPPPPAEEVQRGGEHDHSYGTKKQQQQHSDVPAASDHQYFAKTTPPSQPPPPPPHLQRQVRTLVPAKEQGRRLKGAELESFQAEFQTLFGCSLFYLTHLIALYIYNIFLGLNCI